MPDEDDLDDDDDDGELGDLGGLLRAVARAPSQAPSSVAPVLPGNLVGRYRVVSKVGQGAMGVVYKATHEATGEVVALKVLQPLHVEDANRRLRFQREASSLAAVTHPNVAAIKEVSEADGRVHIVMEFVEGATLRESMTGAHIPVALAVEIAKGIARGLSSAHEKGIVHRDLKPDNVMIRADGAVKLLDFGLAKLLDDPTAPAARSGLGGGGPKMAMAGMPQPTLGLTKPGQVLGTPGYMSPEQAAGRAVDARSDVFALGVVLYEMLAGTRPFKGDRPLDVIAALRLQVPEPVETKNPEVSPALAAVVARCLSKPPEARYPSAKEVVLALDALG